jgi:hypothetical protein
MICTQQYDITSNQPGRVRSVLYCTRAVSVDRTVVNPGHDSACAMQHLSLEDPPRIVGGGGDPGREIQFRHGTEF